MKLVRDNIPAIAQDRTFKKATGDELVKFVTAKIMEEAVEVTRATSREERIEELADLREIMLKYAEVHGIQWDEVLDAGAEKNKAKGKFDENWILE